MAVLQRKALGRVRQNDLSARGSERTATAKISVRTKNIIVVSEDEVLYRKALVEYPRERGYRVHRVWNPLDAASAVEYYRATFVVMDRVFPKAHQTSREITKQIHRVKPNARVFVAPDKSIKSLKTGLVSAGVLG
ncbi:hypothetical protein [Thalassospira lucentensis]|uniref:hypothetical protein n=1 Tax=Thalassospira lucentensis TaxID=168935 RepID=UPI0003B6B3B0|nr:hypothetical protein [Thalassospira lucentensis]RCK29396.1 hypothetical protein TH1_05495 [Thalassospira lucentensis MCCC 1A00383 = DSM 14000]